MGIHFKSASSWPLFCALIGQLVQLARAGNVPVMLWCGESSSSLVNPLHKTSRPEFEALLAERLGKAQPPMIVFVKDNFCVEDIKHHKQSLQQLNNGAALTYLTSVESALSVFENLSSYNVTMEGDLDFISEAQLALVQVNDLSAIPEIYNMLRESSPNLITAVTGKSCAYSSLERVKRADLIGTKQAERKGLRIQEDGILFYSDNYPIIKYNDSLYQLDKPTFVNKSGNDTVQDLLMNFNGASDKNINLTAHFVYTGGYTTLTGLYYKAIGNNETLFLQSKNEIYFPRNFSYHCSLNNTFSYKDKTQQISVSIENLQVETNAIVFSDAYDCIGFMSIPIWTGIFVTAILALIMIWGLTMIMDIRTMDRFDDPKGKTITISAQE